MNLLKKKKIHNIFHVSLLKQNNTKITYVDKNLGKIKFDVANNEHGKYKVKNF